MRSITIELDNDLEQTIDALSRQEGQEPAVVILEAIRRGLSETGLSETERREQAVKALDALFAVSAVPPFSAMTEDEVLRAVDEEVAQARAQEARRLPRG